MELSFRVGHFINRLCTPLITFCQISSALFAWFLGTYSHYFSWEVLLSIVSLVVDSHSTGMKCLPACKVASAQGIVLHDWHAEIVCLRALNRFLLEECRKLLDDGIESRYITYNTSSDAADDGHEWPRLFRIRKEVNFHMYCSEAPCNSLLSSTTRLKNNF